MKKTLFRQLLSYLLIFGIFLSIGSYLVIEFFFDDYYYSQQEQSLVANTTNIADEYNESGIIGFQLLAEEYTAERGMSIHLFDVKTGNFYGTEIQGAGRASLVSIFSKDKEGSVFISTMGGQNSPSNWLSYIVKADNGNMILGRISYTSMDAVVGLVQQFFLFFGIALAFIFIIFAFFFSRSMSKPLKKLNAIAAKMSTLDFSMRYKGKRPDEIGELGRTLNALTSKLENTISQLKAELSKEKTLEQMRTKFTAQVSHELQTPLSVIKGYAEALSDKLYKGKETDRIYEILLAETEKISNMVDDLLDLSQMESGAYIIRKADFSLVALVKKLFKMHDAFPYAKKFSMNLEINCPNKLYFLGDSIRLEQALRNIITNAIKHVEEDGKIKISLSHNEEGFSITVFNSGFPIPSEDLPNIFESYYQGKNSRGGTGLGLAITKHIINLHNGVITAENKNNGVNISILLP